MLASILISAVSVVLLGYWFRYSCLLLLRAQVDESLDMPGRLSSLDVRRRLHTEPNLEALLRSLERDYRVVTYLLEHSSTLGAQSVEDRLLRLDYKLMQAWYCVTRTVAPQQARCAVVEMAGVLSCLARRMDQQAALQSQI
jgi:hypothetical protein